MIHHIKSLHADGQGLSIRAISAQLSISRNTVRKYLRMEETEISQQQNDRSRTKRLDDCREFIVHELQTYPKLSAVKVLRKLRRHFTELTVSDRSVRRYVETLRQTIAVQQPRYYTPILDMVPGAQCQVDPGELRGVFVNGLETVVYFCVFVLSYSRLMYVATSRQPLNTECFIRMHDAAFRYFGGRPEECVYDQTKLVVLKEEFRELTLNRRFHEYATHAGYRIWACEGYDPESKGKVEAGVKYVKGNALYGEAFEDWAAMDSYLLDWLNTIANRRVHGTTGQVPQDHYDADERATMSPYLSPSCVVSDTTPVTRKADKTGLIAWRSNKYSVPMAYQRSRVAVMEEDGTLQVADLDSGARIACHAVCLGTGQVIRNTDHYRDRRKEVAEYEAEMAVQLGSDTAARLCALLKASSPKIYKDQLVGALRVLEPYSSVPVAVLERALARPRLTATGLRELLAAYVTRTERLSVPPSAASVPVHPELQRYAPLSEVRHDIH